MQEPGERGAVGAMIDRVESLTGRVFIHFLGGLLSRPPPDGLPVVLGLPAPCWAPPPLEPPFPPPLFPLFDVLMRVLLSDVWSK